MTFNYLANWAAPAALSAPPPVPKIASEIQPISNIRDTVEIKSNQKKKFKKYPGYTQKCIFG